ncbi:MAG: hypothetical protein ACKVOE_09650 [Rickettsiales bacterium]
MSANKPDPGDHFMDKVMKDPVKATLFVVAIPVIAPAMLIHTVWKGFTGK